MTEAHPLLNLYAWQAMPKPVEPRHVKEQWAEVEAGASARGAWTNRGSVSPDDLYIYLRARFGAPNGFLMLAKRQGTDNLVHWHYCLRVAGGNLQILGTNRGSEFMYSGATKIPEGMEPLLGEAIKSDFFKWCRSMSEIRKSLERWVLFVNPYVRIVRMVEYFTEHLRQLDLALIEPMPFIPNAVEYDKWASGMSRREDSIRQAAALGTAVRMLCPVAGEAFVNVFLLTLAKPEVRSDQRLYQSLLRSDIDVRVRSLNFYCNNIVKQIDVDAAPFSKFRNLMQRRNDLLHGNVDPTNAVVDSLLLDQGIPLFHDEAPLWERILKHALADVGRDQVEEDWEIVTESCIG